MSRKADWKDKDPRFREESARYGKPVPSREHLLKTLADAQEPLGFDALVERLGLHERALRQALSKRLAAMVRDGQLLLNRTDEYCLIDRLSLVVGTVSGHRDGFGFLVADGGGDDLFLPYREMRMLMHGDRAAARVIGRDERGRPEGTIVEVLERRTKQVAGRFSLEAGVGFVVPDNRRISHRVVIPPQYVGPARHEDLVVAEIIEQPSRNRDPVGKVTRVLPQGGSADTAIDLAIASHGLPHEFSAGALRESRKYGREVDAAGRAGRLDLREFPLVTIDGEAYEASQIQLNRWRDRYQETPFEMRPRFFEDTNTEISRLMRKCRADDLYEVKEGTSEDEGEGFEDILTGRTLVD